MDMVWARLRARIWRYDLVRATIVSIGTFVVSLAVTLALFAVAGCSSFRASGGYTSERQGGTKITRVTIGSPLTFEIQTTVEPREGVVRDVEEGHFDWSVDDVADAPTKPVT